jgi:hypothetical protein
MIRELRLLLLSIVGYGAAAALGTALLLAATVLVLDVSGHCR